MMSSDTAWWWDSVFGIPSKAKPLPDKFSPIIEVKILEECPSIFLSQSPPGSLMSSFLSQVTVL